MPLLEWTREYSVGSEKMDNEHKMLFSIINDLADHVQQGEGNVALPYAFTQMKAYSIYHFASEESMLDKLNYAELDIQKKEHAAFIERINLLEKDFEQMRMGTIDSVITFLKSWWTAHILREDKKYAGFIK